jgi:malonyl-CoA decarboxylase
MNATKLPIPAQDRAAPGFFERALDKLGSAWNAIAGDASRVPGAAERQWRERIRDCLEGPGGEIPARARTAALGHEYLTLAAPERGAFLRVLAEEFGAAPDAVLAASEEYRAAEDRPGRRKAAAALARALDSPRLQLLRRFSALPQGVKFLVDLRAELIDLAEQEPIVSGLLDDLTNLLRSWFDIGLIEMQRISWDSPASLLEKLIAYEAVHAIAGWDDLKNRLDSDRRCFAFFHPRMPGEPIIFVEVALSDGIAGAIQLLLDPLAPVLDPRKADTAIFYSISNAQAGLSGISFGNFLIKQVVERLAGEFPQLRRFATLSPMPGFVAWLKAQDAAALLSAAEKRALPKRGGDQHPLALTRNPEWFRNATLANALKEPLLRFAARYLVSEKRADGKALDPVAHFHLTNGARVEQINWLADVSEKGLAQSCGVMVNYLYKLGDIDANHEAYAGAGRVQAASPVRALAK